MILTDVRRAAIESASVPLQPQCAGFQRRDQLHVLCRQRSAFQLTDPELRSPVDGR